jgi:hypothetical protein
VFLEKTQQLGFDKCDKTQKTNLLKKFVHGEFDFQTLNNARIDEVSKNFKDFQSSVLVHTKGALELIGCPSFKFATRELQILKCSQLDGKVEQFEWIPKQNPIKFLRFDGNNSCGIRQI